MACALKCLALGLLASLPLTAAAEVLLDSDPIETDAAFLLPDHASAKTFYYIPKRARVATTENGKPQFTLIQYARTGKDISGGLLHFLVTYGLTPQEREQVEQQLRKRIPDATLAGPVQFVEGEFDVISASAGAGGLFSRKVMGTGKAPLLAGQVAAVSIALTEEGSTLLMNSLKRPTSDVSVQFLLTYQGVTPAYRAILTVDWDKVYRHQKFSGGVDLIFFSADIEKSYQELRQSGAIKLEVLGQDEKMDALLQTAYTALANMMFEANPASLPEGAQASRRGLLGGLFRGLFGGGYGYQLRQARMTGTYTVDLTRRMRDRRQIPIVGNLGDVYRRYGSDPEIFGFVDLDDPAFQKRTIQLILDGEDYETFKEYINFAGITFQRKHDSGNVTTFDKVLDRDTFAQTGNRTSFEYLRKNDRAKSWLNYEYRTLWSFRGGVEVASEYRQTDAPVITLVPPYRYRTVQVLTSADNMEQNDLLFVTVRFRHSYRGKTVVREVGIREGEPLNVEYRYLSAPDDLRYEYQTVFFSRDGGKHEEPWRKSDSPFVYAYLKAAPAAGQPR